MNRFIVLAVVIASVAAEAPSGGYSGGGSVTASRGFASSSFGGSSGSGLNEYVDEALLARVAAVIESDGDGTATGQDNQGSQYVDAALLSRVASSFGSSGSSGRAADTQYGAPTQSGSETLGQPMEARRIAEWDLSETSRQSSSNAVDGGYSSAPAAPAPAPQQPSGGYGVPSRSFSSGSSSGSSGRATGVSLGRPEPAQKVAEFDATEQGQSTGGFQSGGSSRGGYQ